MYQNEQPYGFGYEPRRISGYGQMQPMYQPYQQAPNSSQQPAGNNQQQDSQMFCRPVASIEEARAVPVDFSGKPMLFPQLNAGRIYLKIFDTGSGSAIFREFRLVETEPEQKIPTASFAPASVVEQVRQLGETVAELQAELKTLKTAKRKVQTQEAIENE